MLKYEKGYISGTFDLFHVGHLEYLYNAKSYCNKLIVGVNEDLLVYNYKGRLPIISCEERAKIISALKFVDKVIEVTTRDKKELHSKIRFDLLIMSDNWKHSSYYKNIEEEMKSVNVDVLWLPYKEGISTTIIINRILKAQKHI